VELCPTAPQLSATALLEKVFAISMDNLLFAVDAYVSGVFDGTVRSLPGRMVAIGRIPEL
jgi:hypothetical protein